MYTTLTNVSSGPPPEVVEHSIGPFGGDGGGFFNDSYIAVGNGPITDVQIYMDGIIVG